MQAAGARCFGGEALQQEELFDRGVRRGEELHGALTGARRGSHDVADAGERILPGDVLQGAVAGAHLGTAEACVALDPAEGEAPDVAHPVVVDLGVVARRHADEAGALGPLGLGLEPAGGAAALRASGADGVDGVGVVPRARAEAVLLGGDGPDRADVHEVAREQRVDALIVERRDLAAVAAVDDADLRVAVDFAHEALAPRAHDAAVAIEHERRPEVDVGLHTLAVEGAPREVHAAFGVAELVGEILQRALAALVADRAVKRVVDEQELEHARPALDGFAVVRVDHHALGYRRRAGRLQLGKLLDLHQADAARGVDAETGVVAVIRHLNAGLNGRLQHRGALRHRNLTSIDRESDGFHA